MEAENLILPRDTVSEPAKKAAAKILTLKDKVTKDKTAIDTAKGEAVNATASAKRARAKIDEVLKKLLELLREIDTLDMVDTSKLNDLEKRLDKEIAGARAVDGSLNNVVETHRIIRDRIKEYTVDIERLKREMKKLEDVIDILPNVCKKRVTQPEGK
jgi:chromosome segregation ATPase